VSRDIVFAIYSIRHKDGEMKRIFKGNNRKSADLTLTVMASQDIATRITVARDRDSGRRIYEIRVRETDYENAAAHLAAYGIENNATLPPTPAVQPFFFRSATALFLVLLLSLIHIISIRAGLHDRLVFHFGVSTYFLSQGETFRAVTALFLHSDTRHLLGNATGILVLVGPLMRLTGPGTGSLMLLGAGTAGNLIAASLGRGAAISIGASTAVMGAAGILAAFQAASGRRGIKRLGPIAAGATLMAMFSHGERTDIAAHLFGFLAGVAVGFIGLLPVGAIKGSLFRLRWEILMVCVTLAILLAALVQARFLHHIVGV